MFAFGTESPDVELKLEAMIKIPVICSLDKIGRFFYKTR